MMLHRCQFDVISVKYASGVASRPFAGKRKGQYCNLLRLTNIAWGKKPSFHSEIIFFIHFIEY